MSHHFLGQSLGVFMALANNYPQAQGLYNPANEHDA
jgi:hypothetical protein